MLVRKTDVVPVECVVRGYLAGSGWKEYRRTGAVCGIALPAGLREGEQLPEPIFTPATKAETGHDENISFEHMAAAVGGDTARGFANDAAWTSTAGRPSTPAAGDHHRRHEVRVGPAAVGRADPDRRGADARQFPLLAGRRLPARAAGRRRSTSSSSATGWKRRAGTRTARRRSCRADVVEKTRQKYLEAVRAADGLAARVIVTSSRTGRAGPSAGRPGTCRPRRSCPPPRQAALRRYSGRGCASAARASAARTGTTKSGSWPR